MEIRYVTADDSRAAISEIYERSWKHAYSGIIPQDYLDSIPQGRWESVPERAGMRTMLCLEDAKPVGVSSFGASRFEGLDTWGEIVSLYLLPEYTGRGIGRALLERVVAELRASGYERIFLWVLEENARARRFYERCGFRQTPDFIDTTIGGKALREVRYALEART